MASRVELHRHPNEASALQEASERLRSWRGRTFWIDVKHLAAAIHDHSKFRHFVRTKQAVKMRMSVPIDVAFSRHRHRHVLECAIAHRQSRDSAYGRRLTSSSYVGDVGLRIS